MNIENELRYEKCLPQQGWERYPFPFFFKKEKI